MVTVWISADDFSKVLEAKSGIVKLGAPSDDRR
jgi:hypothetical protein